MSRIRVRLQGTAVGAYQGICADSCNAVDGHEDKQDGGFIFVRGPKYYDSNGLKSALATTRCNFNAPVIHSDEMEIEYRINNSDPRYPRVKLHEEIHIKDMESCCKKAIGKFNMSGADQGLVKDTWKKWVDGARPWLECRAYTSSYNWVNDVCLYEKRCNFSPKEKDFYSDSANHLIRMIPYKNFNDNPGSCKVILYETTKNERRKIWSRYLINNYAPEKIFVSDSG